MASEVPQDGALLREIRKRARRTQKDIANAAGIDQSYLSFLESGARIASDDVLNRIATALGVPVDLLRLPSNEAAVSASTRGDNQ
ncbi:helix-turn-helix domain-containing protein [Streptosporangium sandarakinum]